MRQKKQCRSQNLSVPHDHVENFRGTGLRLHYRAHPQALAHRCETPPLILRHLMRMKMRRSSPLNDVAMKTPVTVMALREEPHDDHEESTLTRRPPLVLRSGRLST